MSKKDWNKELGALKSDDYVFNVPYHATLGEAADIAVYVRMNHKADKKSGRPGLADGTSRSRSPTRSTRSSRTSCWRTAHTGRR